MKFAVYKAGSIKPVEVPGDGGITYKTRVVIPENMPAKTVLAGFLELPAGVHGGLHDHENEEIYFIVSGKAIVECEGERKEVEAGEMAWISSGVKHRAMNASSTEPLKLLYCMGPKPSALK